MSSAPPLRFLALVVGGWAVGRAAFLVPWAPTAAEAEAEIAVVTSAEPPASPATAKAFPKPKLQSAKSGLTSNEGIQVRQSRLLPYSTAAASAAEPQGLRSPAIREMPRPRVAERPVTLALRPLPLGQRPGPPLPPAAVLSETPPPGRWSASAWAFVRRGEGPQLASAGTLGGSQIGGRINYRLNRDPARPLSVVARGYSPLNSRGAEAAVGVEWQPFASLPVRLLAERRQALDKLGRSAFSLVAYGGVSDRPVVGPLRLDAYAQAGIVGLESRDAFVDGAATLNVPLLDEGRFFGGAGVWGAAQPGVERLDAGPQVSWRLFPGARVAAEWRFRLAGEAEPGSGPVLIIAKDF